MKDVLGATKDNRDITKMLGASPESRDKLAIALGPQRAREFQAMLHAESIMQKLKEAVQGNSSHRDATARRRGCGRRWWRLSRL